MPVENYLCEENLESGGVHSSGEVFHKYRDLRRKLKEEKARCGTLAIRRGSLRLDFHHSYLFLLEKNRIYTHNFSSNKSLCQMRLYLKIYE